MFNKTRKIVPLKSLEIQNYINKIDNFQFSILNDIDKLKILDEVKFQLIEYFSQSIDLSKYKFFYITSGITDGLNYLNNQYLDCKIEVGTGDYEYLNYLQRKGDKKESLFYVSNPSAIDGNYISNWNKVLENKRIILDCAYIGTAAPKKIEINDNVETVLLGLSKTFGLYENRVGFIFTNKPIPLLHSIIYDNSYFNIFSCMLTLQLLRKFFLGYIHSLYKDQQYTICKQLNLKSSDVCFIATSTDNQYSFYRRNNINRICLTEKIQML